VRDARHSHEKLARRSLAARLWSWRYLILRRLVQSGVLLLFFGTLHWAWQFPARTPLLSGNLSASELAGLIPMADPFAALQIFLAGHVLHQTTLIGAAIVLLFYLLVGGRVFCAWVCPVNPVTDLAGWLRTRLNVPPMFHLSRTTRYYVLGASLVLSALTGLAAFEWVSPIGMAHREIVYGLGAGAMALGAIFLFDLLILRHGWCGHLCPLGAFWSLVGRLALVRVRFDKATCSHCAECARVCPEPQVLNLKRLETTGVVDAGECSNCGRCTALCPESSLSFDLRPLIRKHNRLAE
jgi:ferredoxin-type protein NapH